MAFPDYGPLREIAQFTQDGFSQGSFLFQLFAGEIANTMALHYLGLLFALIGALLIVFMKKFHNPITIISWTFLVLVLLIGPRKNTAFFTEIQTSVTPGVITDVSAFTPQAAVVDVMSKIHRAIYLGFFDISDPSNPRARNAIEDWTKSMSSSNSANMSLKERPDIQQEVQAYKLLQCGNIADLTLPLYDNVWETTFNAVSTYPNFKKLGKSNYQLSKEHTFNLQQKIFRLRDIGSLLAIYGTSFKAKTPHVYPPFGAIYLNPDNLKESLTASGVSDANNAAALQAYIASQAEELDEQLINLSYAFTSKKNIIDSTTNITHLHTPNISSPTLMGFINNKEALENPSVSSQAINALTNLFTQGFYGVVTSDMIKTIGTTAYIDPIEQRLTGSRTDDFLEPKYEAIAWSEHGLMGGPNLSRSNAPIAIGFITPPIQQLYKNRAQQSIAGQSVRDISKLSSKPYFNVLSNCSQLHSMVRRHIADALFFQNAWPNHTTNVTLTGGRIGSSTQKTGQLIQPSGIENYVSGTGKAYRAYPYNTDLHDNANSNMIDIHLRVQNVAQTFTVQDQSGTTPVEIDGLLASGTIQSRAMSEVLRRAVMQNIITDGLQGTNMPQITLGYSTKETQRLTNGAIAPRSNLDVAMTASTTSDMIKKNLPNLSSGWLQDATSWVADIGTKITAQFAGVGAVAFVRFIQLFISIALFFILMCTPILYMMGLVIPAHAPGVIAVSLMSVIALKAIPIGYTLVDAVMSNAMQKYNIMDFNDIDMALMLYVTATAYTSVTLVTFFLLFKAGDTATVLGQISSMDKQANDIADTAAGIVKSVAGAAALAVTAGVGGAIGGVASGAKTKDVLASSKSQAFEVFGKNGLAALPGVGNAFQEVTGSYREGKGEATIRSEVRAENETFNAENAQIRADLAGASGPINPDKEKSLKERLASNESQQNSFWGLASANADAAAQNKYRNVAEGGRQHMAAGRAHKEGQDIAESRGTSMEQMTRENRDTAAKNAVYQSIGNATKNMELKDAKVSMAGSSISIDAEAARAIQKGTDQADRIKRQADPKYAENARQREIQKDTKNETDNILESQVEGQAAKYVKSAVTVYDYDEEGKVKGTKPIPQDPMYDQAASDLKKAVQKSGDPQIKGSTPSTLKNISENVSAKVLAAHSKGEYEDGTPFKLEMDPQVKKVLEDNGMYDKIADSRNAKDFWIDPDGSLEMQKVYNELNALKNANGSNQFNVPAGHSISLFNGHLAASKRAQNDMIKGVVEQNKKINQSKRNS